jgi:hypothetical protein
MADHFEMAQSIEKEVFFLAGFQLHRACANWGPVSRQHISGIAMCNFHLAQKDFSLLAIMARIISPAFSA